MFVIIPRLKGAFFWLIFFFPLSFCNPRLLDPTKLEYCYRVIDFLLVLHIYHGEALGFRQDPRPDRNPAVSGWDVRVRTYIGVYEAAR